MTNKKIKVGIIDLTEREKKNQMYTLISNLLEKHANIAMQAEEPDEKLLELINEQSLEFIKYIFKEEPVIRKRKVEEEKRIYYAFYLYEDLIFEYGIEETNE